MKNKLVTIFDNETGRILRVVAAPAAALMLAQNAHALTVDIDLTDILAQMAAVVVSIVSLGMSVLSIVVVVKMFVWMKSALGGR
ncbi:major capsid protein [Chitinimonas koreensis]|uniref:major capsid protein n=1 Tax=Chitinimonas koreensis TaxID=356302 RepID=UPI0003F913E8|nr:major capsid protein [Chitinimonas koreensis]QNM98684.1 hypothetical protein H9L41_10940 [Chitinimonas koreensis]